MSDTDSLLVDATTRIFKDLCDPQTINAAKDDGWKVELWTALEEAGLSLAWVPEEERRLACRRLRYSGSLRTLCGTSPTGGNSRCWLVARLVGPQMSGWPDDRSPQPAT